MTQLLAMSHGFTNWSQAIKCYLFKGNGVVHVSYLDKGKKIDLVENNCQKKRRLFEHL